MVEAGIQRAVRIETQQRKVLGRTGIDRAGHHDSAVRLHQNGIGAVVTAQLHRDPAVAAKGGVQAGRGRGRRGPGQAQQKYETKETNKQQHTAKVPDRCRQCEQNGRASSR